jgi:acyl carrier protein
VKLPVTVDDVVRLINSKLNGRRCPVVLGPNAVLRDIGLSSLQIADVIYTIEDRLAVAFDPVQAADVATIGDLVALADKTVTANVR